MPDWRELRGPQPICKKVDYICKGLDIYESYLLSEGERGGRLGAAEG